MSDALEMVQRLRGRVDRARLDLDAAMMVEYQAAEIASLRAELAKRDEWVMHWQTKCQATRSEELKAIARAEAAEARALAAEDKAEEMGSWIEQQAPSIVALYRFDSADDARRVREAFDILAARARAALQPKEPGHGH